VRGVVEVYDEHTLVVTHRTGMRRSEVEFVAFPKAAHFEPPRGGVMVVFRVGAPSSYHTPDDAQGSHEWIEAFACELVAVEASRAEAVAAAQRCAPKARDGETPWAFGPGPRGGWVVRFPGSPKEVEVELDASLSCIATH
jgi:hypothetical protein